MGEKIKKEIIEWIKVIILAIGLTLLITSFVRPTLVIGSSMADTFNQ